MKVVLKISRVKTKTDMKTAVELVKSSTYSKTVKASYSKKEITFYPILETYDIQAIRFALQKCGFGLEGYEEK